MSLVKPETQAVIWMDDGVLLDRTGGGLRVPDRMAEAITHLREQGIKRMAVVTLDGVGETHAALQQAGLLQCLGVAVPIISAADYEDTLQDKALTTAFIEARDTLGAPLAASLAVVGTVQQVPLARRAGLPVLGFAGSSAIAFGDAADTRTDMTYRGAFCAVSAVVDLTEKVMQFKPFKEPKWQPMAAP